MIHLFPFWVLALVGESLYLKQCFPQFPWGLFPKKFFPLVLYVLLPLRLWKPTLPVTLVSFKSLMDLAKSSPESSVVTGKWDEHNCLYSGFMSGVTSSLLLRYKSC